MSEARYAAKEREIKARFTFPDKPGSSWMWIGDPALGFVPATFLEDHAVGARPPLWNRNTHCVGL